SKSDPDLVIDHSITLDGLQPNTCYHFKVSSTDASGNTAESGGYGFTTTKDTIPPVISNVQAVYIVLNQSAFIYWDTNEPATSQVDYKKYGSADYENSVSDLKLVEHHSILLTNLTPNMSYYYTVSSTDKAGNTAKSSEYKFYTGADTTPPVVSFYYPSSGFMNYVNHNEIEALLIATDDREVKSVFVKSPVNTVEAVRETPGNDTNYMWIAKGVKLVLGENKLEATAEDFAGNKSMCESKITVDTTAPELNITAPPSGSKFNYEFNITGTASDNYGLGGVCAIFEQYTDYEQFAETSDNYRNWKIFIQSRLMGDFQGGKANFAIVASDFAGNETSLPLTVYIDIQPPTITIANPLSGAKFTRSPIEVSGNAQDDVEIKSVTVNNKLAILSQTLSSQGVSADWKCTVDLVEGENTITATVKDLFDKTASWEIKVTKSTPPPITVDTTPPEISGIDAMDITCDSAVIIWKTNEPATSSVNYGFISGYGMSQGGLLGYTIEHRVGLKNLRSNYEYHYQVVSADEAGNEAKSADMTFTTSAVPPLIVPPTVKITFPENGTSYKNTNKILVKGEASDDRQVVSVTVNGQPANPKGLNPNGMMSWEIWDIEINLRAGSNMIMAVATDNEGNTAQHVIIVFYTPPAIGG
ncbi:MAG: Ig-like domain-containing protein, partial [Candidatus Omnitrophota bacterium]